MEDDLHDASVMPRDLTFHFLQHITKKFSNDRKIGHGGYGVVYKGVLDNGREIAVKKLYPKHPEIDDDKQFKNECINLMRVQHQNVVRLLGYCHEISHKIWPYDGKYVLAEVEERALCFEFLPGASLDKHLSDESSGLGWHARYKIIKGISEGLHYLHNGSKDPIYHLDLKPANILLDKSMMAKIGDFGLSRLVDSTKTITTKDIRGTPGYMPPEYIDRYKITAKFDVFSLGVIIIQIMAGREGYSRCGDMSSQEFINLVHHDWLKTRLTTMSSRTTHEVKICIKIALRCVEADRVKRPTIAEIIDELNKIDTVNRSLIDQVTYSRSKQEFDQCTSSGAADTESSAVRDPRIMFGHEGTSMGTKEKEGGTLEQKVVEEGPAECNKTRDPNRRSGGGTLDKLLSTFAGLWQPTSKATSEGRDGLLWWHNLVQCQAGEVSVAVMQANNLLEDQCCVESGSPLGTVIGVFDGHGGPATACFARDHLLHNLQEAVSGGVQGMTADAIMKAILATEEGFMALVSSLWETKPSLAAVGTCCLLGVVCQGTLFVANLGNCRAVLGKVGRAGQIIAEQLSSDHNASEEGVRKELMAQHPDDPHILVLKHNVWRVKGIIEVSSAFSRPLLSAIPSIVSRSIEPSDRFVIFASDGLWEHLSNEKAVEIVRNHGRAGISRRLIDEVVREVARKQEMCYKDLIRIDRGVRRHFHDDIAVVVLFIDHGLLVEDHAQGHRAISIRSSD